MGAWRQRESRPLAEWQTSSPRCTTARRLEQNPAGAAAIVEVEGEILVDDRQLGAAAVAVAGEQEPCWHFHPPEQSRPPPALAASAIAANAFPH